MSNIVRRSVSLGVRRSRWGVERGIPLHTSMGSVKIAGVLSTHWTISPLASRLQVISETILLHRSHDLTNGVKVLTKGG